MSRFAPQPSQSDAWNNHHHHHITDRVVLPPLSTAVDNGRRSSQSGPTTSPTAYTSGSSYQYSNTFETARPPSSATSAISSPGLSAVRMDSSDSSSYRRPSINRNGSSMVGSVRSGATSPLSVPSFQDPHSINWNIPPPGGAADSRSSNQTYGAYGEYAAADFTGSLATPDGTPQSPSFAFTSSAYPPQQQNVYMGHPRAHPGLTLAQAAAIASQPTPSPSTASSLIDANQQSSPTGLEEELAQLRTKVRELEFVNDLVQLRVVELENEKAKATGDGSSSSGSSPSRSSTLVGGSPSPSPEFQASWDARTEARIKRFCSLNRAGNALCAWHDSRRERRAYPPRMAPPGTLNCGCTFEEALFEESLSRHRVGSYLPGEMVRMDPALRNPLLKLLQWRYGYKDGDFERDPATGKWLAGEGEHMWQQKATSGSSSSRRHKSDNDSA